MPNSLTAYVPQLWSRKSVAILREKLVMPKLVRVDFSEDLAQAGDIVNTRKPAKMTAGDVDTSAGVGGTIQNVSATNIAVQLSSHQHATFVITDREATSSFMNLVQIYLDPAMLALANKIDVALLGLYTDITKVITATSAGNVLTQVNNARIWLNKQMAPDDGNRVLVLSDDEEGALSGTTLLQQVNTSGGTQTLREGSVGRLKGFDVFRATNVLSVGSPAVRKNLAFHKDCFALVVRPLATAANETPGAVQRVATDPDAGLALRVTLSYNPTLLRTQVTVDTLYGVKTLDEKLGVVIGAS